MSSRRLVKPAIALAALAISAGLMPALPADARVQYPDAQTLSEAGQNAILPQLDLDSQDRATVAWTRNDGANFRIQAVRLGADGAPGQVRTLSAAGQNAGDPRVAVDSQDRATVVWTRNDGANFRIQAVRLGADGSPGQVRTLSAAGQDAQEPEVAVDSQDRATVVWRRFDGAKFRIQAVRLGADGAPGQVRTLSAAGQNAVDPQVAVDSQDRATVAWVRFDGAKFRVQAVRLGADGAPGQVRTLSAAGQNAEDPQVAVDSRDRATVAWRRDDGANLRVQAVRLGANGSPGQVRTLSAAGQDAQEPQVAVDSQDRATVVWRRFDGAKFRIQAVRLGADGVPQGIHTLSDGGQNANLPQVAVDSGDRPTVVWMRFDGANWRIQSVRAAIITPDTRIDSGPVGTTADPTPTFTFSSDTQDVSFRCRIDGEPFGPCSGPGASHTTAPLAGGPHTFAVRAVDATGDADPFPAERGFTVDTSAPAGGAGPPGLVLSGRKRQRLRKRVAVKATCTDKACRARAKGRLKIRGKAIKVRGKKVRGKPLRLKRVRKQLQAGQRKKFKLKIRKKARRAARRALRRDRKVFAKLKVKATDAAGNPSFERRKVRLRLR